MVAYVSKIKSKPINESWLGNQDTKDNQSQSTKLSAIASQ